MLSNLPTLQNSSRYMLNCLDWLLFYTFSIPSGLSSRKPTWTQTNTLMTHKKVMGLGIQTSKMKGLWLWKIPIPMILLWRKGYGKSILFFLLKGYGYDIWNTGAVPPMGSRELIRSYGRSRLYGSSYCLGGESLLEWMCIYICVYIYQIYLDIRINMIYVFYTYYIYFYAHYPLKTQSILREDPFPNHQFVRLNFPESDKPSKLISNQ